ncbi:hypothetical protein ACOMHN_042147 [Nucella lapillus]
MLSLDENFDFAFMSACSAKERNEEGEGDDSSEKDGAEETSQLDSGRDAETKSSREPALVRLPTLWCPTQEWIEIRPWLQ